MSIQRDTFLSGEGDAYEQRNPESTGLDPALLGRIARHLRPGDKVLEIGCGAGANLRTLDELVRGGIQCFGCDPSVLAVEYARERAPRHQYAVATSDELPYDETFDLVLFSFVLHWVDRDLLMKTVAETDRVLRDWDGARPGLLAIADFHPPYPHSVEYHHHPGLWTYKMDYASLFASNPAYCAFDSLEINYEGDNDDRGLVLLRKNIGAGFPIASA